MKNLSKTISIVAFALSASGLFATDLYFGGTGTVVWNSTAPWLTVDKEAANEAPSSTSNVFLTPDYIGVNQAYVTAAENNMNSLTISGLTTSFYLNFGREVAGQDAYFNAGTVTVNGTLKDTAKSFTLSYTDDAVNESEIPPSIFFTANSITMMADSTTSANDTLNAAYLTLGASNKKLASVVVNNDVNLYSKSVLNIHSSLAQIKGVLNVRAKDWSNAAQVYLNSTAGTSVRFEVGGLTSNGQCAEIRNNINAENTSTTLVFKNAAGTDYRFSGKLMDGTYGAGDVQHLTKLNIEMDGDGIQSLSPQDAANCFYTGTVTVKKGTLYLNNTASAGDTFLQGGRLGVNGTGGKFLTTAMHWSGGVLELDVIGTLRDTLTIGGKLEKVGTDKLVFDLKLSASDYASIDEETSLTYDLLTATSLENFGSSFDDDFSILGLDTSKYLATFKFDSATNILSTTIGQIPEPATVAALLGGLALGLAFFRRRRLTICKSLKITL